MHHTKINFRTFVLALFCFALVTGALVISRTTTHASCARDAHAFDTFFKKKKAEMFSVTEFVAPRVHMHATTGTCLLLTGYTYDDHGGTSTDMFVIDVHGERIVLQGSDAVRYENPDGSYYVDREKAHVMTREDFDGEADVLMHEYLHDL